MWRTVKERLDHGGAPTATRHSFWNYLLEAAHVLEVCVFNCEGWYHDDDVEVYCTIPFFSRAEIGLTVAMVAAFGERQLGQEVHRPRPSRPTGETLAGMAQQISLRLAIAGMAVGLNGAETEEQTPAGSYLSVLAINVPRPHEHRLCCDPRSPTLDVGILDDNEINRENTASLEDIVFHPRLRASSDRSTDDPGRPVGRARDANRASFGVGGDPRQRPKIASYGGQGGGLLLLRLLPEQGRVPHPRRSPRPLRSRCQASSGASGAGDEGATVLDNGENLASKVGKAAALVGAGVTGLIGISGLAYADEAEHGLHAPRDPEYQN